MIKVTLYPPKNDHDYLWRNRSEPELLDDNETTKLPYCDINICHRFIGVALGNIEEHSFTDFKTRRTKIIKAGAKRPSDPSYPPTLNMLFSDKEEEGFHACKLYNEMGVYFVESEWFNEFKEHMEYEDWRSYGKENPLLEIFGCLGEFIQKYFKDNKFWVKLDG